MTLEQITRVISDALRDVEEVNFMTTVVARGHIRITDSDSRVFEINVTQELGYVEDTAAQSP